MKKSLLLPLTLGSALLSGCGMAPLISMPTPPSPTTDTVITTLAFADKNDLDDNVVQLASHKVAFGSSVVINVPQEIFEDQSQQEGKEQDFKTKDFFSEAEQAIEKEFIKDGFRVLSRAKLEAELRRLRDESRCDLSEIRCLYSQVSPEVRPILDDLKARFEKKQISAREYADQIAEFRDQMQTSSRGRSRSGEEKELTDISEVIRAAQSSAINADYILQINVFDTNKQLRAKTDLRQNDEIRAFLREHSKAQALMESEEAHSLSCAIVGATLNAKLIHVKSGEIVWIGNHELNELSAGVQKLTMEFGQRTYVTNERQVQNFVATQNTEQARKRRKGKEVQLPAWEFRTDLIKEKISGRCEDSWKIAADDRRELSRNVAAQLINRIKVQ